jgi:hypothetical protein
MRSSRRPPEGKAARVCREKLHARAAAREGYGHNAHEKKKEWLGIFSLPSRAPPPKADFSLSCNPRRTCASAFALLHSSIYCVARRKCAAALFLILFYSIYTNRVSVGLSPPMNIGLAHTPIQGQETFGSGEPKVERLTSKNELVQQPIGWGPSAE